MTDEEKIKKLIMGNRLLIDSLRTLLSADKPSPKRDELLSLLDQVEEEVNKLAPRKPVHPMVKRLLGGSH
jgi:hypothetical protein